MYLHFLKTLILKFQEKHQISNSFKPVKRLIVNYLKKKQNNNNNNNNKNNNNKTLNTLTIRVDCERINGCYKNAEYRGKIIRCDLTLNAGPYAGACRGAFAPPSWANYFKIMQIFTRNWVYIPNFGLKISTLLRKTLKFAPPPLPLSKVCVRAWNNQLF